MKTSGSVRKLLLDGVEFDVTSDANFSEVGGAFEKEMLATSGENMLKTTRRSQTVEGVVLSVSDSDRVLLKNLSEQTDDFPMSYTLADGSSRRASGHIEFEARETEEGKATIKLLPRGEWSDFTT